MTGASQLNSSLLTLSVIAVLLPAAFHSAVQPSDGTADPLTNAQEGHDILAISHGVAIILLFIYLCYLVFQLFSHKNLYDDDSKALKSVKYTDDLARKLHAPRDVEASKDDEEEKPQMSSKMAIALLVFITVVCQQLTVVICPELIAVVRLLLSRLNFSFLPLMASLRAATLAKSLLASSFCQS
jgi:Ca2+:H+ antiporter